MSRKTAVVVTPGRGTYNKTELGYLGRNHPEKAGMFAGFDRLRAELGQEKITALDGAARFQGSKHTRGDHASPLIYAAGLADFFAIDRAQYDIIAVTGNSMGWYTALACAGVLAPDAGFELVNTMGTLMQESLIGGQLIYPFVDENWCEKPGARQQILDKCIEVSTRTEHILTLSIDLGGMLVLAGNAAGLAAFEQEMPNIDGRFPMRLQNHAGFHSALQRPVSARGRQVLSRLEFGQPEVPLIDGRGAVWYPGAVNPQEMWDYTTGHQVVEPYDFATALRVAAREFMPDLFIVTGPGATLGSSVAQSLLAADWRGLTDKATFQATQSQTPRLLAMGREDQRALVTCEATQ